MRGFLQFLFQNGSTFLFLLLEALCFYMVVRFNDSQREVYLSTASIYAGSINKTIDNATNYLWLKSDVDELMRENALLRQQLYQMAISRGDSLLGDSLSREDVAAFLRDTLPADSLRNSFVFVPANIINNSIVAQDNTLTIDRGRRDGVASGMGVISNNGLVGIVMKVSERYATVMSLLHRQTRISASIRRTGYFGVLRWGGESSRYMYLEAIPRHEKVYPGDTIQTSGYSNIFPSGIMVGLVHKIDTLPGDNYYNIQVELSTSMAKLQKAYVVKSATRDEVRQLEQR